VHVLPLVVQVLKPRPGSAKNLEVKRTAMENHQTLSIAKSRIVPKVK